MPKDSDMKHTWANLMNRLIYDLRVVITKTKCIYYFQASGTESENHAADDATRGSTGREIMLPTENCCSHLTERNENRK